MGAMLKFLAKPLLVGAVLTAFLWRDTFNPESLRGARVLVTGASAGIGEQLAYHYARHGAQLVVTARREKVLQEVSGGLRLRRGQSSSECILMTRHDRAGLRHCPWPFIHYP
ncbi:hydroxysteroid 11-beta-dehydrogenase 1-like protein [Arapaima gigas]